MTDRYVTDGGPDRGQSEQSYRFTYDVGRNESPSEAVVRAVAAVTNTSPLDLEPLHDVIDPDTLNRALEQTGAAAGEMAFTFGGCAVTVTQDEVRIADAETDG